MKLVTWNTQWCCGLDGIVSPERIVEVARRLTDFDVLCLQEIAVNYPGLRGNAGHDQPAMLRELLPGFQVFFGAAVDEWSAGGERRQFGNLVATRLPVAQLQHHALPYPADGGVSSMPRMCTVVTLRDPDLGAMRVMTTHLEFYSKPQRMAQARALRELHIQACCHAAAPPEPLDDGSAFQTKIHTVNAILCGDFNLQAHDPEYALIQQPFAQGRFWDSWRLLHGEAPRPPTFRLYDREYGPDPIACDFILVSDGLKDKVKRLDVDNTTRASDHQPVAIEL
ncbi:MAG TPA: endonuclease/exonuclease/phosphatase family protein [Ramlibacter sp.]|nr:endonuclease/exonuclease/phosphatase family protein [Ramlibacter sp.]